MKAIIQQEWHRDNVGIWFYEEKGGKQFVAQPVDLHFVEAENGFVTPDPTISLRSHMVQPLLQSLINELVRFGYRPDSDRVAGELAASKENLKDLRNIIDKVLAIAERKT